MKTVDIMYSSYQVFHSKPYEEFYKGCQNKDSEVVSNFIMNYEGEDYPLREAMAIACANGDTDLVAVLLTAGKVKVSANETLANACNYGQLKIVEFLLNSCTRVEFDQDKRMSLPPPKVCVELDINFDDGKPLRRAIIRGDLDIVKLLVKEGAKLVHEGVNIEPCIITAARYGRIDIVGFLLQQRVVLNVNEGEIYIALSEELLHGIVLKHSIISDEDEYRFGLWLMVEYFTMGMVWKRSDISSVLDTCPELYEETGKDFVNHLIDKLVQFRLSTFVPFLTPSQIMQLSCEDAMYHSRCNGGDEAIKERWEEQRKEEKYVNKFQEYLAKHH